MTKHAKLSASGSSKWLNCPGSIKAEEEYRELERIRHSEAIKRGENPIVKTNEFALEGTIAHQLAEICLINDTNANQHIDKYIEVEFEGETDNHIITDEMAKFVQEYLDYVRSFENQDTNIFIEQRVDFSNIVSEGFGTCDAAIIDYSTGICHVIDLKYGKGVEVLAENNTQAQLYALGFYNEYKFLDAIKKFTIHIVQPRKYNFSSWDISIADLEKFGEYAYSKSRLALSENPKRIAGEKQCQWCEVKGSCKELMRFTEETISAEFQDLSDIPDIQNQSLSNNDISKILTNKKLIESFLSAVEEDALEMIMNGEEIPNFKVVQARSNRKWNDDAETILSKDLGDKAYVSKLLTITNAQKLLDKETIDKLTFKPDGKLVVAKESDKRKAVTPVVNEFDNIEGK